MPFKQAISSMSLGRAWVHGFEHKLNMAHKYGYQGLELFYEDLEYLAKDLPNGNNYENRIIAARQLRQMCDQRSIKVISMQPFYHYEGLRDRKRHEERIVQLHEWFQVAKILGTDLILIPSNFLPADQLSGSFEEMVADLREVADLGLRQNPVIRFCYESLAWGTYVSTWQKCWEIVCTVDRSNMGICLDAFNIAALVYADPTSRNGRTQNHSEAIRATLSELVNTIDVSKLFIVQLADAELLQKPLVEGHEFFDPSQPARMSWSRNCRLFYGESGSYLPTRQIMETIVHGLGYKGWISAELFNRRMADVDHEVPEELAKRGSESWQRFKEDFRIENTSKLLKATSIGDQRPQNVSHEKKAGDFPRHHTVSEVLGVSAAQLYSKEVSIVKVKVLS